MNMKHFLIVISCFFAFSQTLSAGNISDISKSYKTETLPDGTTIYLVPDTIASFGGGQDGMIKFLSRNLRYPVEASEKKIQGVVYVKIVVRENGQITDVDIQKPVHELLDNEAKRVVGLMPNFVPAKAGGRNVASYLVVPIRFALK